MTFDDYVNLTLWLATWLTFCFYVWFSKAPRTTAWGLMIGLVVTYWGTAILLKFGVPGGDNPFFWISP